MASRFTYQRTLRHVAIANNVIDKATQISQVRFIKKQIWPWHRPYILKYSFSVPSLWAAILFFCNRLKTSPFPKLSTFSQQFLAPKHFLGIYGSSIKKQVDKFVNEFTSWKNIAIYCQNSIPQKWSDPISSQVQNHQTGVRRITGSWRWLWYCWKPPRPSCY